MKIGIIFPGYSSQFVGMGKELYDEHRVIQEYFEEAYNCLNNNFIKLCFASSDSELSKPTNAYPSIFLVSSALYALLLENNIKPDIVAGHGTGYFTAIHAVNSLTFPDGLYLLKKFSSFYEEVTSNLDVDLLKIEGISSIKLKKMLKNDLQIAMYNNDIQHLVCGNKQDIQALKEQLKKEYKIKALKIDTSIGLYSELMNNIADQVDVYLEKVDFKDATIPVISAIDGSEILTGKKFKKYLIKQITSPVKWNKVMDRFKDMNVIIQVGPGTELAELIQNKYPDKKIFSINKASDFEEIKKFFSNEQSLLIHEETNVEQQLSQ